MDIATTKSEEIFNLKNFDSTFKYKEIVECPTNGQFVILQMNNSNEIYAVPCSKDTSEQDIFEKLTKDGFLVEKCQEDENRFV